MEKLAKIEDVWDYRNAYGSTAQGKFEMFEIHLQKITTKIASRGAFGYFWVVGSTKSFKWIRDKHGFLEDNQSPRSISRIIFRGTLRHRWAFYESGKLPEEVLILGAGERHDFWSPEFIGKLILLNLGE